MHLVGRGHFRYCRPAGLLDDRNGDRRGQRGHPVPPGQYQEGYNDPDDDDIAGFAFGAPSDRRGWDSVESVLRCGECGNVLSFRVRHVAVPWTYFRRQWERYLFVHIGVVTYATMPKL